MLEVWSTDRPPPTEGTHGTGGKTLAPERHSRTIWTLQSRNNTSVCGGLFNRINVEN